MARHEKEYVCQSCGSVSYKWSGKCENCGAWNTLIEEKARPAPPTGRGTQSTLATNAKTKSKANKIKLATLDGQITDPPRMQTGIAEFDRVIGGGFVQGSAVLLGGDPGIGKSTILLQVAAALANKGKNVIYISGEEALAQLRMRASRLELGDAPVYLGAETNLATILATLQAERAKTDPALVIIDSIQTIWSPFIDSAPGTVSQVRAVAQDLIYYTKASGAALVLVGHVTKEGQIAGPRVLEHMVDTVVYFESDSGQHFRILRAVKNRFGATDEIGVFEMCKEGLVEVSNPSALFMEMREQNVPGTAIFAGIEGTRPLLVEIQALVVSSSLAMPRRAVIGWDANRLSMVLAVLEARCGLRFGGMDVFLNVAGGLRIQEPAADLAVATALISSISQQASGQDIVTFGEISLSGAVRSVSQTTARLKEAAKLGFTVALAPLPPALASGGGRLPLKVQAITELADLQKMLERQRDSH
ncbi:MAG: DNA repair protein RadA [Alphaproteobacteria bacterium]|nr:DNA repair protein RadA [Alphaproteobacteria bacterium]